jgi:teichuronic acid exporter
MTSLVKKSFSGLKWLSLAKITAQIFSWASTFFVIRLLSPDDYGLISISIIFVALSQMFSEGGYSNAIVQKSLVNSKPLSQIFTLAFIQTLIFYSIIWFTSPFIETWFDAENLSKLLKVMAISLIVSSFIIVPNGVLRQTLKFKYIALVNIASALANSSVTLLLAFNNYGVWSLVFGNLFGLITRTISINIFARQKYFFTADFSDFKSIFDYGIFTVINRVLYFIFDKSDIFIIGRVLGVQQLGFFAVTSQIAKIPIDKSGEIINQISLSTFSIIHDDNERFKHYILQSTKLLSIIIFPVFFGLASVSFPLVNTILGEKWEPVSYLLCILPFFLPFRVLQMLISSAIDSTGNPKFNTTPFAIKAAVVSLGLYIGLTWGLIGGVIGWGISYLTFHVWYVIRSMKYFKIDIREYISTYTIPLFAALIMSVTNLYLLDYYDFYKGLVPLLILVISGGISYLALLFLFGRSHLRLLLDFLKL